MARLRAARLGQDAVTLFGLDGLPSFLVMPLVNIFLLYHNKYDGIFLTVFLNFRIYKKICDTNSTSWQTVFAAFTLVRKLTRHKNSTNG
jgi:hypothetical protein